MIPEYVLSFYWKQSGIIAFKKCKLAISYLYMYMCVLNPLTV